ncbi:MAG: HAMP domain-containing histidine kinase [Nocardioides sp.]|nr:HAMP domain-containing histidine kinase [Nocardioides sp.]
MSDAQVRGPDEEPGRARSGIASRLLVAQGMVLVAGAVTTWLVASAIGPTLFRDHLQRARVAHTTAEAEHVQEAFNSALLLSIAVALLAATITALAVTWYFTRRVQRSIAQVASAASEVAAGRYDSRVGDPGLGSEFVTLAATYNQLAQRLGSVAATRRRMLADLAHEMRTPLATVDAHLEAIEDGVRQPDATTLGVIRDSTRRLRRLAEDITAVSHAEEGKLDITVKPVDAAALAETAAAAAQDRFAAKGVHLTTDLSTRDQLLADPDRVGQVLGNLLDNALRHTPAEGTVTLTCRREGRWIEYVVTDTGDGIEARHIDHIFDRFYRADTARDRSSGGSGIGLSITKALVEAQGGSVCAESPGLRRGTRITVRLWPTNASPLTRRT